MSFRILVVDDDKFLRDRVPGVLADAYAGAAMVPAIDVAGTPETALGLLAAASPQEFLVILCDYNLRAARTGLDVLAEAAKSRPDAVRILFSGHSRQEIRGLESANLDGFIEKPFKLSDLGPPFRAIVDRKATALSGTSPLPPSAEVRPVTPQDGARGLANDELVPALVRATTKGEQARALTLYDEAGRRGKQPEAEREATRALVWQNRVLELVATGSPLEKTLAALCHAIEDQAPGLRACAMLVDESGTKLRHGAAPRLPDSFVRAVEDMKISPLEGSCGAAAHERRIVVVSDTQTDPRWASRRELARDHGIAACWSSPIVSPGGRLFGTFALYAEEPRGPDAREALLMELATSLARVAIESHLDREALRASESRYRTLFNSIDQGFFIVEVLFDPHGQAFDLRYVEVNHAFEAHTGIKDPTGTTVRTVRPATEQRWYDIYGEVARTGIPTRFEERAASIGRWFELFAFRVGEPSRNLVGVLFNDITLRRMAAMERESLLAREKAALAETVAARERLRATILHAPIPIAILRGPDHVFELANEAYGEISGRDPVAIEGKPARDVFPEVAATVVPLLDGAFRRGEPFHGKEVPFRFFRGGKLVDTFFDFVYQPSRDATGAIDGIIVVAHEVTDKLRARQALETTVAERAESLERERGALREAAAQRQRLRDLFMQAPAAIAIVDGPEYVFSFANPHYCELVGKPAESLLGQRVVDALPEVVDQGIIPLLDGVRDTGVPFRAEALPIALGPEGARRQMHLNFVYQPVYAEGRFVSIMAHAVDVSEQVEAHAAFAQLAATLEERVKERTRALEETNRDLESFSYVVSHDLRAPLRAVHDLVGRALVDVPDTAPNARDSLVAAKKSTEEMAGLIESMLGLARASQTNLRQETVDLTAIAKTILDELARQDPSRRVETRVAPGLATVGDPRLLRSMLENLLGNAWKFTSPQSHPLIEVGSVADQPGSFYVRDNGVGFDPSHAQDLFTPFRRLDHGQAFEGTGIGLATVRRILERHGGRTWAEAKPNEGATFYFAIPPHETRIGA